MSGNQCIIKEFFPYQLVLRDLDHKNVVCKRPSVKECYEKSWDNFFKEAEILKGFNHHNIVKYMDHFSENNTEYIVTAYCSGKTLDKYIEQEQDISISGFLKNIMIPLIDVMQELHERGIIHRDIKPNNIIINEKGQPVIIDFGSAIHYQRSENKQIFVTPGFSPLEFYAENSKQGRYSDIYSLAATLYYYLCGKAPKAASERVIEDKIEDIRHYNSIISGPFSHMIMKNLTLDYRKRYSSLYVLRCCIYLEYLILKMKRAG
jgi:serine/threonine protein kinase